MSPFRLHAHSNGTHTVVDTENGQAMHSRIGPWEEALTVYADASRIAERWAMTDELVLHDVGMGTGANALAAITRSMSASDRPRSLRIESFEAKPDGLTFALAHPEAFSFLAPFAETMKELLKSGRTNFSPTPDLEIEWRLWTGDYFTQLSQASLPDLIFYDFYAPKTCPELWTRERFAQILGAVSGRDCELYTYSAATPVRLAMLLAGWSVGQGLRTAIKTETTIATNRIALLAHPLGAKWKEKLAISSSVTDEAARSEGLALPQIQTN